MGIQADIKDALTDGREAVIETLATNGVRPTVVDRGGAEGSSLLGKSTTPTFTLETADGDSGVVDRQTTVRVVDTLDLTSAEDAEAVQDELQRHPDWSG